MYAGFSHACFYTYDPIRGETTQTRGYAGLAWALGVKNSSALPDVVVGVRSIKVNSDDKVSNGADLSARFTLKNGFAFDSARLSYVEGKRDLVGNIGVGYSLTNKSYFTTISAQGAYSRLGLDYEFSKVKFVPFIELLTVPGPDQVKAVCNPGDTLLGSRCRG